MAIVREPRDSRHSLTGFPNLTASYEITNGASKAVLRRLSPGTWNLELGWPVDFVLHILRQRIDMAPGLS
jgi:hypothetical protein